MTVTSLGRDQDCSLKIRELDVPASWFLDPGGWSKTTVFSLYFIFPGICTLSLVFGQSDKEDISGEMTQKSCETLDPGAEDGGKRRDRRLHPDIYYFDYQVSIKKKENQ
ncbi:hypothetical protein STEG23_029331 [Scotinomys teguina]